MPPNEELMEDSIQDEEWNRLDELEEMDRSIVDDNPVQFHYAPIDLSEANGMEADDMVLATRDGRRISFVKLADDVKAMQEAVDSMNEMTKVLNHIKNKLGIKRFSKLLEDLDDD